ncbi:hypothetical protein ACS6L2_05125 [Aquirufa ecclesiirivi]
MSNKILFVFEGDKTEKQILYSLQNFFVNEDTIVKCVYGAEIYQIFKDIEADEDLDTFNLLKERNAENVQILNGFNRNDFSQIYLFFDYDGHSTLADDDKFLELLNFFNEETDKGKLYISYPMVESIKHIVDFDKFKDLIVECKENIKYKNIVHENCLHQLKSFKKYDQRTWNILIDTHLKKLNYIVNDSFTLPDEIIDQILIFSKQLDNYILPKSSVAVLNSFPIFLHDYYGNIELIKRIK